MNEKDWLAPIIGFAGTILAWLLADARSKARLAYAEERMITLEKNFVKEADNCNSRLSALEIRIARSEQDRGELHKSIERLDNQKASKEIVDGFRSEVATLRFDMDKRFDRLERILEASVKQ